MTDAPLGSLCPQCGYDVKVDEEGCCISCGGYSIGPGADEAHRYRNTVRAKAPDDAKVAAIERPVTLDEAGILLESWRASGDRKKWAVRLAAALDAARARCAEVQAEAAWQSQDADGWCGKWARALRRWLRAGSTIRRLRRRWQWERRRAEKALEERDAETAWRFEARAERDAAAADGARQAIDYIEAFGKTSTVAAAVSAARYVFIPFKSGPAKEEAK